MNLAISKYQDGVLLTFIQRGQKSFQKKKEKICFNKPSFKNDTQEQQGYGKAIDMAQMSLIKRENRMMTIPSGAMQHLFLQNK